MMGGGGGISEECERDLYRVASPLMMVWCAMLALLARHLEWVAIGGTEGAAAHFSDAAGSIRYDDMI